MTLGPRTWQRCREEPVFIAIETTPGKDGQCGSMSLCAACREICGKLMPNVKFEPIKKS